MNVSVRFLNARHRTHVIARAIACSIMVLVLPSCGIPPLRHWEPGPGLPTDFNGTTSPDNSSQLGIEEFYNDRMLTSLIEQALFENRELKNLNEEVQISGNEVLARSGAYLPFVSVAAGAGLDRYSRFTEAGAGILDDAYLPGKHFTNPSGNFGTGLNLSWQLDIYRQLRNARDAAAQRYVVASERPPRPGKKQPAAPSWVSCGFRPSLNGTTAKN
jgi:multidrug efflux system outer membrane protein